jgi:heat shock protein HslJ
MKKILFWTLIVLAATPQSVIAKQKKKTTPPKIVRTAPQSLVGFWELTYLEGVDVDKTYKNNKPRINFDPKRIQLSGNNSCNTFSGQIKIEGNKIIFVKQMIQTMMACEGDGEQKFMAALNSVQTFAFSEANKLDLIAGDRGVMQFTKVIKQNNKK